MNRDIKEIKAGLVTVSANRLNFEKTNLRAYDSDGRGWIVYQINGADKSTITSVSKAIAGGLSANRYLKNPHISIMTFPDGTDNLNLVKAAIAQIKDSTAPSVSHHGKLKPHTVPFRRVGIYSINNKTLVYKFYTHLLI